ncbi:uncharacterized protein BP01DRAFT_391136 [Aspergillus saccharolyticus JOP 1030-1]|uniref:FAD/NAD(P)-binding domain-containing protein n=1 Tax=Aspergillus saccharolyticus JOP 1030-1 TaxID=1450539 RepID=A0A318ZH71_9EURO|nr:hypothetical protein BP01DRAFT_391136 [Aspergillus saccharolyticus JOP 1030-1]PYH46315.1 hypothetical protein BP01DRAFT_391136 [Aspergillus saccharolyticus JOP 1030-1]
MCRPTCPRALISDDWFDEKKLLIDIRSMFAQYHGDSFRFIHGTVTTVDHINKTIPVSSSSDKQTEQIAFQALVVASGVSTLFQILGLKPERRPPPGELVHFPPNPSASHNRHHRQRWTSKSRNSRRAGRESQRPSSQRVVVRWPQPQVHITLVTSASKLLPALRPAWATKAKRMLADVGVSVIKNARLQTVHPATAGQDHTDPATVTLEDGRTFTGDIYIPATGTKSKPSFLNRSLLAKPAERVYAIRDVASYAKRLSVHGIWTAVPILCANVSRDLLLAGDKGAAADDKDEVFTEDTRETQIVPIEAVD